jgi:hypothetical protein
MIRDRKWQLGFLMGSLLSLWMVLLPILFIVGKSDAEMNDDIGAGGIFIVSLGLLYLLMGLMVLLVFFRRTRALSFGFAVSLLVLQILLILLMLIPWDPGAFGTILLFNLPGYLPLLVVGIVYALHRVRRSRERSTLSKSSMSEKDDSPNTL